MFGFYKTDDPIGDYERYDHDLHKNDHLYPVCEKCGEHVLPGHWYARLGGKYYHEECVSFHEMGDREE